MTPITLMGLDLTGPIRPWPGNFRPLTAEQAADALTVLHDNAETHGQQVFYDHTAASIMDGNTTAAYSPEGRLAVAPTLRGQRRLN